MSRSSKSVGIPQVVIKSNVELQQRSGFRAVVEEINRQLRALTEAIENLSLIKGPLTVGSETDYLQIDESGHLTFVGEAAPWDDLRVEPIARATGTNAPAFEKWYDDVAGSSRGVYLYSFDDAAVASEKEIHFTIQMPHSWNGGPIDIHVHWVGAVADTAAAPCWGLEYVWKDIGQVFGDTTIVYSDGKNYVPGGDDVDITAHKHYISEFAEITPTAGVNDGISAVLIGRLFRNSSSTNDTYNASGAKCGLLYIDIHFQLGRIGSNEEYTA